ncbi:hypothetical protein A2U01_0092944, partial [Trifolium medium]|nr:hypothetical protein [Trifolium medium]
RGKTISYAPDVIDAVFGFRQEDYCWASQQRARAHTDEIASTERPLGRTFFQKAVRELQVAQAAAAAPQPPPQPAAPQEQ